MEPPARGVKGLTRTLDRLSPPHQHHLAGATGEAQEGRKLILGHGVPLEASTACSLLGGGAVGEGHLDVEVHQDEGDEELYLCGGEEAAGAAWCERRRLWKEEGEGETSREGRSWKIKGKKI